MSIEHFLQNVVVIDTETTHIEPDKAEIIQVAGGVKLAQGWHIDHMLLGSSYPIPPEASATHFISNRMIENKPKFDQATDQVAQVLHWQKTWKVAHNCVYDQTVLHSAWSNVNDSARAEQSVDSAEWICTYRLAKHLLQDDFPDMKYSLGYMRYRLDLDVPDHVPGHRADGDVLTCALLLEFLVEYACATQRISCEHDVGTQLNLLCWQPIPVHTWPYGKHKGQRLEDISTDYYLWAMENMEYLKEDSYGYNADLAASVAAVLEKRIEIS